jgi:uncharacterized protein (DUF1778 family)
MSDVLYARAQPDLKALVDAYAESRGVSMNGAIIDLVTRGLASVAAEDATRAKLEKLEADKARLLAQLDSIRSQTQNLQAFANQAKGTVGTCPECDHTVTGLDLLLSRCPKCGKALSSLPATSKPLDTQLILLIGAVALLAGAAVWAAR